MAIIVSNSLKVDYRDPHRVVKVDLKNIIEENSFAMTCILATCNRDGNPNTAPISSWIPVDYRNIIAGIWKKSKTFSNIMKNSNVMVEILWSQDISFGISGNAKIIKESLDCNKDTSAINILVESVKVDTSPMFKVISGPIIECRSKKAEEFSRSVHNELLSLAKYLKQKNIL